jgi:hypothetical protein
MGSEGEQTMVQVFLEAAHHREVDASANVPGITPASEMTAIRDTKRSWRRARKYRKPIRNSKRTLPSSP